MAEHTNPPLSSLPEPVQDEHARIVAVDLGTIHGISLGTMGEPKGTTSQDFNSPTYAFGAAYTMYYPLGVVSVVYLPPSPTNPTGILNTSVVMNEAAIAKIINPPGQVLGKSVVVKA